MGTGLSYRSPQVTPHRQFQRAPPMFLITSYPPSREREISNIPKNPTFFRSSFRFPNPRVSLDLGLSMNSSHFMDKQIMGLSGSQSGGELLDLMSSPEDNQIDGGGVMKKEEIVPSYDFQPIRTVGSSPPLNSSGGTDRGRPSWGSADSKLASASLKVWALYQFLYAIWFL